MIFVYIFALFGFFCAVVSLVAKFKNTSFENAKNDVCKWIKENCSANTVNPQFVLYPAGFEQIIDIVAKHSRLSKENTFCENLGAELTIQILPVNDSSIVAAIEECKICIKNIAIASNCLNVEIDACDVPFLESSRLLKFLIATTEEQKAVLASNQYQRMHQAVLDASINQHSFVDSALDKDMRRE